MAPRLSYLPFLLSSLKAFFTTFLIDPEVKAHLGWFSIDGVPLKWQHPVGLLYDLFSGTEPFSPESLPASPSEGSSPKLPWKLTLHFSEWPVSRLIPLDEEGKVEEDAFINSVKEADFLRNGTAKIIMGLGKEDSTKLWTAVKENDRIAFMSVHRRFLDVPGLKLRVVPMKIYLPATPELSPIREAEDGKEQAKSEDRGTMRIVQGLVAPETEKGEKQTLGMALHTLLPTVFPSARRYIHAQAVLHGAVLPPKALAEEVMRAASYADGFLHVAVVMFG